MLAFKIIKRKNQHELKYKFTLLVSLKLYLYLYIVKILYILTFVINILHTFSKSMEKTSNI